MIIIITRLMPKSIKHIPCSFTLKDVFIDNKFTKLVIFTVVNNAVSKFIKAIFEEYDYCKNMVKKHFNKNIVIFVRNQKSFKSNSKCWICNKLFAIGDNKVRDHYQVTGKYRSSVHLNCNINLKLTRKIPVIFVLVIAWF